MSSQRPESLSENHRAPFHRQRGRPASPKPQAASDVLRALHELLQGVVPCVHHRAPGVVGGGTQFLTSTLQAMSHSKGFINIISDMVGGLEAFQRG